MKIEEMKDLYATGHYICIWHTNFDSPSGWYRTTNPTWVKSEDVKYKLIHKLDADVLDYLLNGGRVYNEFFNDFLDINDFVKYYHEDNKYRIIIEEKTKPVERITREMLLEARDSGDMKLIQEYAFRLLDYFERNQKDNQ